MKSLTFLIRKSLKNMVVDIFKHPAKLISYLLLVGFLVFALLMNTLIPDAEQEVHTFADINILHTIYFLLLTAFMAFGVIGGISKGGSFFKMPDVNYVFTAPISPRKVLVYGLIRSLGTVFLVSFFVLFYAPMLQQNFGIQPGQVVALMLGYLAVLFISQLATVLVYSFTTGNSRRQQQVKYGFVALLAVLLAYIYITASGMPGGLTLENVTAVVSHSAAGWFPVSGWVTNVVFGVLHGEAAPILVFSLLTAAGFGLMILAFVKGNADYYEDVLQNTESTYAVQQAAKEGRLVEQQNKKIKIKENEEGIQHGNGASVFFYKQLKEASRKSRLVFLDLFTLLTLAICIVLPKVMGVGGEDGMTPNLAMVIAVMTSIYLLFFSNATGGWVRELTKPYIYLAPCSAMRKLIWATAMNLLKSFIDGVIAITIGGLLVGLSVPMIILFSLIYFSFGAVFTTTNLLAQRLLGQVVNKGMIMLLYMLILLVLLAPGLVGTSLLLFAEVARELALLPALGWNLAVSIGIYAICHNTLHTMESC